MLRAGRGDVGDRRRLRDAHAEDAARRARRARAHPDEHAGRAGAHQVQARVVRGAAADDDRHRHLADELLEVQRRARDVLGDVLGRDDRALDDEHVEPGLQRQLVVLAHALRGQRRGGDHAHLLDLADALGDELGLDRRAVDLLHLARRDLLGELRDALELVVGVLVTGPDPLEVEHGQATQVADDARGVRRHNAVHGGGHERQLEAIVAELPGDVDVVGVARATRRDDGDVVESVGSAGLLPAADLNFHGGDLTFVGGRNGVVPRLQNPGRDAARTAAIWAN